MSNSIPVYVASTSPTRFEPTGEDQQYFFSTNGSTNPSYCLMQASNLIAGVKEIIQTESDAAMEETGGISNVHYTVLAVLEMASALIDSVAIRTGGAA